MEKTTQPFLKIDEFFDNACAHRGPGPLAMFHKEIKTALETTGKVPADLEDTITASVINVNGKTRAIINWV